MPTITFSLKDLQNLVGKKISIEEIERIAIYAKAEVKSYDSNADEIKLDCEDTNLPYLWSVEGFARFLRGYLGLSAKVPQIKMKKADYGVIVDKSVMKDRPHIVCFAAKGKKVDDYFLRQLVQLQEKFCESYGRRRQKVSIGLYSYKRIAFPLHYKAVNPDSLEFVPLEFKSKLNLREILEQHPKGKEYSYILNKMEKYPVLVDDKEEVLSLIPIVNSNFTGKVEVGDDSMFFEATGTDEEAVMLASVIFAYALYERGFEIYACDVKYPQKKTEVPNISLENIKVSPKQVEEIFGIKISESEMKELSQRAQYDYKNGEVTIPPYRKDILHPRDVVEDIGIMYGYENIPDRALESGTEGSQLNMSGFTEKLRDILAGLGCQEIVSAILTNKKYLYEKMEISDFGTVEIEDFMSETYSVVRSWLLPNVMNALSENKHVEFPHKIFEEGIVNENTKHGIADIRKLAVAVSHEDANYTQMRQIIDLILRMFGLTHEADEFDHRSFIDGRCAKIIVKGKPVAFLGEIHPKVLKNWGIEMPACAMEINVTELFSIVKKQNG